MLESALGLPKATVGFSVSLERQNSAVILTVIFCYSEQIQIKISKERA